MTWRTSSTTLRQTYEYVIAGGDGGDAPAAVENAEALALAALQHGFSLIVQLNDLGPAGAPAFVGRFLQAMISAPRELWRPVLVVLDEAQRFAPQEGATAATDGVRALTAQGRKRGFTAVLASQRIAKIDANVRGDVNNWLLGRVGQALDRRTVADALGFTPSSAEARGLQSLPDRSFWAFGPAISREPVLFRVADVETTPVRPGQAKVPTPPPAEALRAILQGLAPAPSPPIAADPAPPPSAAALQAAREGGRAEGLAEGERRGEARGVAIGIARAQTALAALRVDGEPSPAPAPAAVAPKPPRAGTPAKAAPAAPAETPTTSTNLSRATQAIIATLEAAWPRALPFLTAAKHAGVGLKSSQFSKYEPELRASGRAEEVDGKYRARVAAPSGVSLLEAAAAKMSPAHARVLRALESATEPLTREALAQAAGVSVTSSTTAAALSTLADMDMVERDASGRFMLADSFRADPVAAGETMPEVQSYG